MKPGTQADIVKKLGCSRGFISNKVKAKDYRIIMHPNGEDFDIAATVKAFKDSGFGKRSKPMKKKSDGSEKKTKPVNGETEGTKGIEEIVDIQNYIGDDGKLSTTAPRAVVARYKEMQSAEKDRIKNERDLKKLVDFNATSDAVFNFLRPFRDDILDVGKRISAIAYQAGSKQKAQKAIDDEIERIFKSRVGDDYRFDDELKKKITKILLMSLQRQ